MRYYRIKFNEYDVKPEDLTAFCESLPLNMQFTIVPFYVEEPKEENTAEKLTDASVDFVEPRTYESKVPGNSKLVENKDTIFIAKRRIKANGEQDNTVSRHCVCIDDETAKSFFAECKSEGVKDFKIKKSEHENLYNNWFEIMQDIFEVGAGLKE